MFEPPIAWDIYEVSTRDSSIHGVMFRGRIRKYGLQEQRNILTENATDVENVVRVAVPAGESVSDLEKFLRGLVPDTVLEKVREEIHNPVLSKLKVNIEDRYTI